MLRAQIVVAHKTNDLDYMYCCRLLICVLVSFEGANIEKK